MKFIALLSFVSCATMVLAMPTTYEESTSLTSRATEVDTVAVTNATISADLVSDVPEDDEEEDEDEDIEEDDEEGRYNCLGAVDLAHTFTDEATLSSRAAKCSNAPNAATMKLIEGFEGWVNHIYKDPIGLPTVGYGHLCIKKNCAEVPYKMNPLSKANGEKLLKKDLLKFRKCIDAALGKKAQLNANQFGALLSWGMNVGCGNVKSSTLVKRLNKGESPNKVAAAELIKWNKAGGKTLAGLTRRRKAEVTLFKKASKAAAHPC